ncbi:hypothetical protein ABH940_003727 [Streptacidiphilus sp. BW17]
MAGAAAGEEAGMFDRFAEHAEHAQELWGRGRAV